MAHPYISVGTEERAEMLHSVGVRNVSDLFKGIQTTDFDLPDGLSEWALLKKAKGKHYQNYSLDQLTHFLGAGVYDHIVPAVIDALVSRGEFLTAYTPYQPEVSQGSLQLIYEFQTYMTRLYGMDVSNASVYDGAHALVECVGMALRIQRVGDKSVAIALSQGVHPEYVSVLKAHKLTNVQIIEVPVCKETGETDWDSLEKVGLPIVACVNQFPNVFGVTDSLAALKKAADSHSALSITVNLEPYAYGLHNPPGAFGIHLVAAEAQALGNPPSFGGPHVGVVLCEKEHVRQLPGRLVGRTKTMDGKQDAFTLTLSTREQHIRRERATSNICTNQGLVVNRVVAHCALLGERGFKTVAEQNHLGAHLAFDEWSQYLAPVFPKATFFNEFLLTLPKSQTDLHETLMKFGVLLGVQSDRLMLSGLENVPYVLSCVTEKHTPACIHRVTQKLAGGVS